jgi:hypothetical protein
MAESGDREEPEQRRLLESAAEILRTAIGRTYTYRDQEGGQAREVSIPIIVDEQLMDARLTLAENLIQQASLSEEGNRTGLQSQARIELNAILASGSYASSATQAAAIIWLASISTQ